jgi:hypothetical protein
MSGHPGDTPMFDYDARPVTPRIVLVGERTSSVGYAVRDFLSRNGFPYEWGRHREPRSCRRGARG